MMSKTLIFGAVMVAGAAMADVSQTWTVTWADATCTTGTAACSQGSYVLRVKRTGNYAGFGLQIGLGTAGDSVYSVDGLEYLDLRGAISGLDLRADPATNAVWKFSRFGNLCFKPNDGTNLTPAQYITGVYSPGTLVSDTSLNIFHIDSGSNPKNTKEVIIDEPNVTTSIGGWYLNSVGSMTNLIYRVPKVQTWSGPTSHGAGNWNTDMGFWDVSGVKYVSSSSKSSSLDTYSGPLGSGAPNAKGILRLPSLVNISAGAGTGSLAAFHNVGIGEVELGLSGNLEYLANYSFTSCNNLTNVVIGASPAGKTLTICTNAFWCGGIKTVYFNGEKPDIKGQPSCPSFGSTSTPEGQITFYVRDIPSWADVLAEADANGGFVAAATMGTKNRQRVVRYSGLTKVTVELQDPRFADVYHETVTMTTTDGREGDYHYGEITLTATCTEPDDAATNPRRARFLRWDGVPLELERVNPLTYVPAKNARVQAVFAHDWLMTTDAEPDRTMDNGFWRVTCHKRDTANFLLGLGKASNKNGKGDLYPATKELRKGGGDLNLNGDVWEPLEGGGWQKWTTAYPCSGAAWHYPDAPNACPTPAKIYAEGEYDKLPTRYTLPETLIQWPGEIYNCDAFDNATYKWPLAEMIGICPNVTNGTLGSFSFGGVSQLKRVVIRAPGLTRIGTANDGWIYGIAWTTATFDDTNFDEWDLTGVTDVAQSAFYCNNDFNATGTLYLPNLVNVGSNAFVRLKKVTGFVAGTNKLSLKTLGDKACSGMTSLTNVTLGTSKSGFRLGNVIGATSVFANLTKLKTVHFPGRVLPQETVDAILTAVPESATTKQVTVYASPFNFWDSLAAAPTEDEEAIKPEGCFGVYRDGLRKAWFVAESSPFEPEGTAIIVR